MKTRQELILDFMLALAPNYLNIHKDNCKLWEILHGDPTGYPCPTEAESVFFVAASLADQYLENV